MVLPIVGPISQTIETPPGATYRSYLYTRNRYRQKAPFTLPLPYTMYEEKVGALGPAPQYTAVNSTGDTNNKCFPLVRPAWLSSEFAKDIEYATRTARSKFNAQIKPDQSQLANLYLERKQALDTLANRGLQLAAFVWLLKKDPLRAFNTVLRRDDAKGWKRARAFSKGEAYRRFKKGSRSFGDTYIELAFGILPTIGDISSAVDVLGGGVPPTDIRVRGTYQRQFVTGAIPSGGPWRIGNQTVHQSKVSVTIGARISVSNPNLFLANQLGLINLGSIIWEATPWSFVVDYFLNVSDWLSQWTDEWGLNVQQAYYTTYATDSVFTNHYQTDGQSKPFVWGLSNAKGTNISRTVGAIPRVSLGIRRPWTLSAQRASTSIALLLQRLR